MIGGNNQITQFVILNSLNQLSQRITYLVKTTNLNWLSQMHTNNDFFVILTNLFIKSKLKSVLAEHVYQISHNNALEDYHKTPLGSTTLFGLEFSASDYP